MGDGADVEIRAQNIGFDPSAESRVSEKVTKIIFLHRFLHKHIYQRARLVFRSHKYVRILRSLV